MQEKKANGVYYTPKSLADYLVKYIFEKYKFNREIDVLEPSCGNGVFLNSLINCEKIKKNYMLNFNFVEKDKNELLKAINLVKDNKFEYYNGDYLEYSQKVNKLYDLIIGNPPYIKRSLLTKAQVNSGCKIIEKSGMNKSVGMNIWITFLISSIQKLKKEGVLCFVLPAELLQVKYSDEIRRYLNQQFSIIEIFKFNELIFKDIEQNVIVLIGIKGCMKESVIFHELENLHSLTESHKINVHKKSNNKWVQYSLDKDEIETVNYFNKEMGISTIKDFCHSKVGIVTGANEFFILNNESSQKYKIKRYLTPIIKKSSYLSKSLVVNRLDLDKIENEKKQCLLLYIDDSKKIRKNSKLYKYLEIGRKNKIDKRYKCNKRTVWYKIPYVDISDGLFFKRTHIIPKIAVNQAKALVTDTAYRIYMNSGYNIESLVFSFYNSLTLMFVELLGRSYGGGVLELTPNEFKALPLPYIDISKKQFTKLDNMLKNSNNIDDILKYTDYIILNKGLGLSNNKIMKIRQIRSKLLMNRIGQN